MSVLETVNRTQFKQNLETAIVEAAVYTFTMQAYRTLQRQVACKMISPEHAQRVWRIHHACYDCFVSHLKAERLKELMMKP